MTKNTALRDRILRERGLAQEEKVAGHRKGLKRAAPKSEINTPLAGLLEYYWEMPVRMILKHYTMTDVHRQTRIAMSTLKKWKKQLEDTA